MRHAVPCVLAMLLFSTAAFAASPKLADESSPVNAAWVCVYAADDAGPGAVAQYVPPVDLPPRVVPSREAGVVAELLRFALQRLVRAGGR